MNSKSYRVNVNVDNVTQVAFFRHQLPDGKFVYNGDKLIIKAYKLEKVPTPYTLEGTAILCANGKNTYLCFRQALTGSTWYVRDEDIISVG